MGEEGEEKGAGVGDVGDADDGEGEFWVFWGGEEELGLDGWGEGGGLEGDGCGHFGGVYGLLIVLGDVYVCVILCNDKKYINQV